MEHFFHSYKKIIRKKLKIYKRNEFHALIIFLTDRFDSRLSIQTLCPTNTYVFKIDAHLSFFGFILISVFNAKNVEII